LIVVRRAGILLVAFAVVAACNNPPPPKTPPPQVFLRIPSGLTAVYDTLRWQDPNAREIPTHTVTVVAIDGGSSVVSSVALNRRTQLPPPMRCGPMSCPPPLEPPYVSTSKDRIYVLAGDSTIKEIGLNGTSRTVMSLQVPPNVRAAFAVSPDNRQVAVALIDFGARIRDQLYVEPLGGGRRTNLTTSSTADYWPIGWRDGKVILATGSTYLPGIPNPYSALAYALLDPIAGAQPKLITPHDCVPIGLVSAAGAACFDRGAGRCNEREGWTGYNACYWRLDWTGKQTTFSLPHVIPASPIGGDAAALSPDGTAIITSRLFFATASGGKVCCSRLAPAQGDYSADRDVGWIDATHIAWSFANHDGTSGRGIIDLSSGSAGAANFAISGPPVSGHLVATLTGGL
jgi:hypothetical protein